VISLPLSLLNDSNPTSRLEFHPLHALLSRTDVRGSIPPLDSGSGSVLLVLGGGRSERRGVREDEDVDEREGSGGGGGVGVVVVGRGG